MNTPALLGRALAAAPDPELARVALARVGEQPEAREILDDPDLIEPVARLLGFSTAATDFLVAHPEEATLFRDLDRRPRDRLLTEARDGAARLGPEAGLRRFRQRAVLRVAVRDLLGASLEEVVAEITAVAEACLEVAAEEAGGGLAVLALGKLGGAELNYASDVDVVFVHEGIGAEAQEAAARRAGRVVSLLSEPTEGGVALRVDTALRPDGRSGPLSRSLESTSEYYRRHAATWEKQAWLKARPVAGDTGLGERLLAGLEPVIYPEHLEPSAIDDVRAMKARIEEYVRASGKEAVEVKRGRGGIRDVEFAVQLLQLVHGRHDSTLREPNTLRALAALADNGYVATADAADLADAYRFLRILEHRLQLVRDTQTHELPPDEAAQRTLARSIGLDGPEDLRSAYERETAVARGVHERLFYRPLLETFAGPPRPRPGAERGPTEELLAGLGFRDPSDAYERFDRLVEPGTRLGRVLAHVFPVVAPGLALAPDPDAALLRLERVLDLLGEKDEAAVADVLASDPGAAGRLARVVGVSSWAADVLAADPAAVAALARPAVEPESPGRALVRIAQAYAAGELRVPESGKALARVADAVVAETVAAAAPGVPFAVVGLGKLGAEELNFSSDLDVVFVFDGEGPGAFEEAGRAAQSVLDGIRNGGFEADADLRPEGRSGPLARSMAAWLEYWERWGRTWEFQALLKARFVAGDEGLGARFARAAEDFAYPEYLPLERETEIRRMRVRMEEERIRQADARRFHFKLGYGGLADVQFSVELSQLRHGGAHPEVRRRHTLEALEALARERLIEDAAALALGEAYVFLNEVKNAMEIDRRVHAEALPTTPEAQLALARRLGYEEFPRAAFLEDYRRVTRRARRAMDRVFYPDES